MMKSTMVLQKHAGNNVLQVVDLRFCKYKAFVERRRRHAIGCGAEGRAVVLSARGLSIYVFAGRSGWVLDAIGVPMSSGAHRRLQRNYMLTT